MCEVLVCSKLIAQSPPKLRWWDLHSQFIIHNGVIVSPSPSAAATAAQNYKATKKEQRRNENKKKEENEENEENKENEEIRK